MTHIGRLNREIHSNTKLLNAYLKNGKKGFVFGVIQYCAYDKIWEIEQFYIDLFNSKDDGYNLTSTSIVPQDLDIRKKLSLAGIGEKNSQAKITNKEAEMIIRCLAKGWLSGELSKHLGISNDCIKGIKNRYTHGYLQPLFSVEYSLIEKYYGCRARINPIQVADILKMKIKNPKMTNDEIAKRLDWKPRSRVNDILKKKQGYYKALSENNEEIKMLYGKLSVN